MEFKTMSLETLNFLVAVTKMLNESPKMEGYYLHVELRGDDDRVVGVWTDEVSDTDWLFEQRDLSTKEEARPR